MSGIALLLPSDDMCQQSELALNERKHHVTLIKKTTAETVLTEARIAISQGANIIIARGHQAMEIKRYTKVPVVEIIMTAQELGLMIVKAKKMLQKKYPVIGIFSWDGMLCDTTYFNELYDVEIRRYVLNDNRLWGELIDDARADGIDILLGGDLCVQYAEKIGIPALYISSTMESLKIALDNAEQLYYMYEVEQQNYAQFSTVLDSSFNGIIKTDANGTILLMNRVMEQLMQMNGDKFIGKHVTEFLNGLDQELLNRVLDGSMESFSTFLNTKDQALVIVIEPIVASKVIIGSIISCSRMKRLEWKDDDTRREQFLNGYIAHGSLDNLADRQPDLKSIISLAKLYSLSSNPIFVQGNSIAELEEICEGIHNYSLRKNGPYITFHMDTFNEDEQMRFLLGKGTQEPGAIMKANRGTLVIQSFDKLSLSMQYTLLHIIRGRQIVSYSLSKDTVAKIDVRIIICTSCELDFLFDINNKCDDLYYMLQTFQLKIPDITDRKKDLEYLIDYYFSTYLNLYSRYHILSSDAKHAMMSYPWNNLQLKFFCERMILTVSKRTITEEYVRCLMNELYNTNIQNNTKTLDESSTATSDESEKIKFLLQKYSGNRTLIAKSLGISTTTLWRKIKKYKLH